MKNENLFKKVTDKTKQRVVGVGFVALDVFLKDDNVPKLWAGGTCGNVLAILAYLGWNSSPIARLKNDIAAKRIIDDFKQWNVDTSCLMRSESGSTPIVIERLRFKKDGSPKHRFEWVCPNCGAYFPSYKPILRDQVPLILSKLPKADVFFFDRASSGTLELAKAYKSQGALVMFEPSGVGNEKHFLEAVSLASIVKYSHERMKHVQNLINKNSKELQIQTFGSRGLEYRKNCSSKWRLVPSYTPQRLTDSVGAGDWCSAGVLHILLQNKSKTGHSFDEASVRKAVDFGQALAALNCEYEGARGPMYCMDKSKFYELIAEIMKKKSLAALPESQKSKKDSDHLLVCPGCNR